jgi:hypothetical protein
MIGSERRAYVRCIDNIQKGQRFVWRMFFLRFLSFDLLATKSKTGGQQNDANRAGNGQVEA